MRLNDYLNDTSVLMGDVTFSFNSKFQMIRWINEARRLLAMKTGCIQRLLTGQSAFGASSQAGQAIPGAVQQGAVPQAFNFGLAQPVGAGAPFFGANAVPVAGATSGPFQTIPGAERYPYIGFYDNYLRQQHAGCDKVNDVISVAASWGGVSKPTLDWMPWDEFQAYCRAYAIFNMAYPSVWSVLNDGTMGEVWVFPVPSQANDFESLVTCLPKALQTNDDYEAIAESFQDTIKFGAAALGFMATQRQAAAESMLQQGGGYVLTQRAAADRGKSRSMYPVGY